MHVDLAEQVVVDLGGGLAAADQRDRLLAHQLGTVLQVAGVVDPVARQVAAGLGDVGRGAGAEDQPAGEVDVAGAGAHPVERVRLLVRHLGDGGAVADAAELRRGPAAVVVVLDAQRVEVLPDVEGVQPPGLLEVVEEGVRGGGVGQGDQVRHERGLEVGPVEEHPGVPGEGGLRLQEEAVQLGDRLGEAGQAEVEGAESYADEVVHGVRVVSRRGQGSLPGTARRGRRSGRGRRRCRRCASRG